MNTYIGIDLGTTGLKSLLVAEDGRVLGSGYRTYPISTPAPGYAEQDPQDWWEALRASLAEAMAQARASAADIRGIGLSGQMHGAVLTDADGALICPAVIWADQRSIAEAREVTRALGAEQLGLWTQNPVASGFQLSTLLWMRRHRPELYARARHVLLPKDWLRMRMTGLVGTEPTDACGTLLYDCAGRTWSAPLLRAFDIDDSLLPDCRHAAWEIQGGLTAAAADALGLRRGTPVAFGGADQPMQALGNGILSPGTASVTLGTGGQVFAPVARPVYDPALCTHTFCHAAPDTWYLMGATQNCCLAQNWFIERILGTEDFAGAHEAAAAVPPGSEGLFFLPYLTGERTPIMDPQARGAFIGLTLRHGRAAMTRAVVEGISYSIVDAMRPILDLAPDTDRLVLTGGGARSPLWRQVIADMTARPIYISSMKEAAGTGAAICAMVGAGAYQNVAEACAAVVRRDGDVIEPDAERSALYAEGYARFRALYTANRPFFATSVAT